jgi:predicted RNA methylase
MTIKDIKGLKYPDEYFIKFFFKNELQNKSKLRFLEFGAGNGSNLLLPFQYDHEVIGVDFNDTLIGYARDNFELFDGDNDFSFYCSDMREFAQKHENICADVFTLPNIVNYISKNDFIEFLLNCKKNKIINKNSKFFIRFRTPKDFRYGLGTRIDSNIYRIANDDETTGEAGALNTFYKEHEMVKILEQYLELVKFKVFTVDFENIAANGDVIFNSDIIIWGTLS